MFYFSCNSKAFSLGKKIEKKNNFRCYIKLLESSEMFYQKCCGIFCNFIIIISCFRKAGKNLFSLFPFPLVASREKYGTEKFCCRKFIFSYSLKKSIKLQLTRNNILISHGREGGEMMIWVNEDEAAHKWCGDNGEEKESEKWKMFCIFIPSTQSKKRKSKWNKMRKIFFNW